MSCLKKCIEFSLVHSFTRRVEGQLWVGNNYRMRLRKNSTSSLPKNQHQREGMGQLEYQATPSLRDIANSVVYIYSNIPATACSWVCQELTAKQLLGRAGVAVHQDSGQAAWTVHHLQNYPCWVTLLHPTRRAAVMGQPGLIYEHSDFG